MSRLLFLGEGDAVQEGSGEVLKLTVLFQYFPDNNLNILIFHDVEASLLCSACIFSALFDVQKQDLRGIDFVWKIQLDLSFADLLRFVIAYWVLHLGIAVAIDYKD